VLLVKITPSLAKAVASGAKWRSLVTMSAAAEVISQTVNLLSSQTWFTPALSWVTPAAPVALQQSRILRVMLDDRLQIFDYELITAVKC
jgi:hypothetical protein